METFNKPESFASRIATFACAFACFAALPLGMRASWELDLTPAALACVLAGAWSLGIAAGGYASLFWRRVHTRVGRTMLLIVAAWAAGGACSADTASAYLTLLGLVAMIGATLFAAQFRAGPNVSAIVASTAWAMAGAVAALLFIPPLLEIADRMSLGAQGAWRVALMVSPLVLLLAAGMGYEWTRPTGTPTPANDAQDVPDPIATAMAAAA